MNNSTLEDIQAMFPVNGNFDLIQCTDNIIFKNILDIGLGKGGASLFFAEKGKNVTALGLDISSYKLNNKVLNHPNIYIVENTFEDFDVDEKFDAILMSHVLEHTQNPGYFLEKAFNLLHENGWLFVMVPPYKEEVVGGHITNGWNSGQLMYNLLLSGFDIKKGHFVCHGHNICAFVQKSNKLLPKLRMDKGDIESTKEFWPFDVKQGFKGGVNRKNWFQNFNNIPHKSYAVQLEIKDKIIEERNKLFDVLAQKDVELKKRQHEIAEKDVIIKEHSILYDVLAQKDAELKKRQLMIEEKDMIIKERSKLYDVLAQKDAELKKRQQEIEEKNAIIKERSKLFDVLAQKDEALKKQQLMIKGKDAIIKERSKLYDVLAQKDAELKKQQLMIKEKDAIIKERSKLYDVLAQKDEELKKRQLMIEEKDAIIKERGKLYDVLAQKDEELKKRQQIIEQKDAIINGCSKL